MAFFTCLIYSENGHFRLDIISLTRNVGNNILCFSCIKATVAYYSLFLLLVVFNILFNHQRPRISRQYIFGKKYSNHHQAEIILLKFQEFPSTLFVVFWPTTILGKKLWNYFPFKYTNAITKAIFINKICLGTKILVFAILRMRRPRTKRRRKCFMSQPL